MMGSLAAQDTYYDPMTGLPTGGEIPPAPVDPREGLPRWALQAADAPQGYEAGVGMWPRPAPPQRSLPDVGAPLIGNGGQFSAGQPWAQQAADVVASMAVPSGPLDLSMMVPGRAAVRGATMVLGGSLESDEAQAHKLKTMGRILAPREYPPGHMLHGMKLTGGRPPVELAPEELVSPVITSTSVPPELANAYRDPRLRAKAEQIWGTFPQYAEKYPDIGPPALKEKAPDPKNPGKFLIAPKKGEIPYGSMEEALAKAEEPNFFLEKKLTPEAVAFQKQRNIVQRDMDLHGYPPYFDPAKRANVDPTDYGPFKDTRVEAAPKTAKTEDEWYQKYGTPEARARLQEGFEKGQSIPDTDKWYFMKQLQDEYVKELGEKAGKEAFKKEFSGMMAATTGGASPYNNWLMSQYAGYLHHQGEKNIAKRAYEMPFPIGGRFASGNMEQAQKYIDNGMVGFDPAVNPKRYDFDNALAGNPASGTIDEQMSGAFIPGMTIPEWYGPATRVLHEEAAEAGVDARGFQDVGWAGLKYLKEEAAHAAKEAKRAAKQPGIGHNSEPFVFDYDGPMINTINRSIETTHRLTGMPHEEIVRRGVVRKEIPMYGIGGALTMGALADQSRYQTEERY